MIFLCHASDNSIRVLKFLKGCRRKNITLPWLYLGRNYLRLMDWERALGDCFQRQSYSDKLQTLASEWSKPYLDWLTQVGRERNTLAWWISRISERNTLIDSLYHNICYLKIGLQYIFTSKGPLLIVSESDDVLSALAGTSQLTRQVHWYRRWRWLRKFFFWSPQLLRVWSRYFMEAFRAMRDADLTQKGPALPSVNGKLNVLIHTCIDETYFSEKGPRDRYFSQLAEELRLRDHSVLTLPWLSQIKRSRREAFEWFRQRSGEYVIAEDFYSFKDYLWAAWTILKQFNLFKGRHHFKDLDITFLVRGASRDQLFATGLTKFILYYRLIQKWASYGLKIDVFIDMFENMVTEKPQIMGFRKWMPKTMTVGFEHYIVMEPLLLSKYTTFDEAFFAPHPDVIVCNSSLMLKQLVHAGFPQKKLRVGPSLRYLYLTNSNIQRASERNKVLVILSLDPMATAELLAKLKKAFPQDEGILFWIKRHPMMSRQALEGIGIQDLPSHMICVEGTMEEWLARATCALVVATTSAVEIALAGVPIVRIGRETDFDMDALAWFPEFGSPVYSIDELRAQIFKNLSLENKELEKIEAWASLMRKECISPINDETISAFVKPCRV